MNQVVKRCFWKSLYSISCCLLELLWWANQVKRQHLDPIRRMLANALCLHPLKAKQQLDGNTLGYQGPACQCVQQGCMTVVV